MSGPPGDLDDTRSLPSSGIDHDTSEYEPGTMLAGKIEVKRVLGRGHFGVVYLVHDHEIGADRALKTFRDVDLASHEAREAFRRELVRWVLLGEHPFILTARWVERIDGRLVVEMDHVAPDDRGCTTLADRLFRARRPLPVEQVARWGIQFCYGIEHAYSHGITAHRDVKPSNLLVGSAGVLRIADFGSARDAGADRLRANLPPGSPGYLAPEVFAGQAADARSDLFGLGLVLHQLITGDPEPPFGRPRAGALMEGLREIHERQGRGWLPEVDGPFAEVILRCLQFDPERRWPSVVELRDALEAVLREHGGEAVARPSVRDPDSAQLANWGNSLSSLGRHSEALEYFDRALVLAPNDPGALLGKGGALHQLGRYQESIRCADAVIERRSHSHHAWNNKGASLLGLGRNEEALACFDRALALKPDFGPALNNRATALGGLGRSEDAIEAARRSVAAQPGSVSSRCNLGTRLYEAGRHQEAAEAFEGALRRSPLDPAALSNRGLCLSALGRTEEAIADFRRAVALDERNARAWFALGCALRSLGRDDEALGCFDRCVGIDGALAPAWSHKAAILQQQGRFMEARRCFDRGLHEAPGDADLWCNKATLAFAEGAYPEARSCSERALGLNPRHAAAWSNKGACLQVEGKHDEAAACFRKSLEIEPGQAPVLANLAQSLISAGRVEEGLVAAGKAVARDPANALAWFFQALAADNLGRRTQAVEYYRRFLERAPAREAAAVNHARMRLRQLEGAG